MSLALHAGHVVTQLVLPPGSAEEAALIPDAQVYRAHHLLDVVQHFLPAGTEGAAIEPGPGWSRVTANLQTKPACYPDMADVKGQMGAKRALEIAAAGGHSLLLMGPPGAGKSMLAIRFAGLLPAMTVEEALQSAAVASLGGRFSLDQWAQRPTCHPHHTASAVALVGGGSPPRPGEISLAHNGVLFLDELPEFPRAALEALREPLETGRITISRAARRADFPARFQLIAAMNPCPCGYLGSAQKNCRCTPDQVARYQGKLSGPLVDRIDLHVEVPAVNSAELMNAPPGESTAAIQARCAAARARAIERQGVANQALQGQELDQHLLLDAAAAKFLNVAAARLGWSARSTHRALKVARTIADLAGAQSTQVTHVAEAMQYRRALKAAL
jgi:magnesium chelatase family protein